MQFLLGMPVVNGLDLLRQALESVESLWPRALIIDNSDAGLQYRDWPVSILRPPVPLTFSQTMNLLANLARARSCEILLVMHNDAVAGPETSQELLRTVESATRAGGRWGVAFTHYDTLAAFNVSVIHEVGQWDTNLPHYFADNDYYRRVQLAGYEILDTGLPVLHQNGGSSTIKGDPRRFFVNGVTFALYQRYYGAKWGGLPGAETYTSPFGGASP